jgi:hypothetical protein
MSKSGTSNHIEAYARNGPHLKNSKLRKPSMPGVLAEFVREPQARPVCTERAWFYGGGRSRSRTCLHSQVPC